MFGYVVVNEQDLKIREFNLYRSYYCGMCMDLKEHYGQTGRLTLSYDTAFLALLLTSLYEPGDTVRSIRCIPHPFEGMMKRIPRKSSSLLPLRAGAKRPARFTPKRQM